MSARDWKGVLCLGVVTAFAMGLIWGTAALTRTGQQDVTQAESVAAGRTEEMPVDGYENIEKAIRRVRGDGTVEGYEVMVSVQGYQGPISMTTYFDKTGSRLEKLEITGQQETENLGGKIIEADFLDQFYGISLPVGLARAEKAAALPAPENRQQAKTAGRTKPDDGETGSGDGDNAVKTGGVRNRTETESQAETESRTKDAEQEKWRLDWSNLTDGTYEARAKDYSSGFIDTLTMTVSDGKVTAFLWDATDAGGNTKRVLTAKGEYTMTENGLTWPEQADALAQQVIGRQSLEFLAPDENGKTDAVAGVSISITPFLTLSRQCLIEAGAVAETGKETAPSDEGQTTASAAESDAGTEPDLTAAEAETTEAQMDKTGPEEAAASQVDGISGATISSAAVVEGVNRAYGYLQKMLEQNP